MIVALLGASAAPALAANAPSDNCFFARDWEGWRSPAPNEILIKVGASEIYRIDLKTGSNQLKYPDMHLVNRNQESPWICHPTDFDLLLSDDHGVFSEPLFVTSFHRLSPAEIAQIPPKDLP